MISPEVLAGMLSRLRTAEGEHVAAELAARSAQLRLEDAQEDAKQARADAYDKEQQLRAARIAWYDATRLDPDAAKEAERLLRAHDYQRQSSAAAEDRAPTIDHPWTRRLVPT